MDEDWVNQLLNQVTTLNDEKMQLQEQNMKLIQEKTEMIAQKEKLEKKLAQYAQQNADLRELVKAGKTESKDSLPDELKQIESTISTTSTQATQDERFKIISIVFKPDVDINDNDTVAIMGEFTNWLPEIMDRYTTEEVLLNPELANTFYYKTKLFRGWKYRYQFSVGDQFVVD